MNVIKRLILFSKKHYKLFFIAVLASTLASLLDVSFLYLIKQCTDRHHISSEFTPAVIIAGILLLVVCRSLFNYVAEVWIFKFGRNVIMDIRNLLYDKLLSVKISDVEKKSTGDLTTKLLYQSDQLGNGLLNFLKSVLQEGFVVIGCILALLFMNFMMTLMVLLTFVVVAIAIQKAADYMRAHQFAVQDRLTELAHFMDQTKYAIKTVCMQNVQKEMNHRFKHIVENHTAHQLKINKASALSAGVIHFIITLPLAMLIWLVLVFPNWVSAGDFAALVFGFSRIYAPMKRISRMNVELQATIAAGDSLFTWFDVKPERRNGKKLTNQSSPSIVMDDVSVVRSGKAILKECNVTIDSGGITAFAGETASGKTTLLQVIAGLIEPDHGDFRLDDVSIKDIYLPSWRNQIGFVDQSLPLFNLSIAENIAFFGKLDMKRVEWACYIAALDKDVALLEAGYNHIVEYGGINLSGGQRQRVVLARAIYHAKQFIIIDEATSALDNETEQTIYERLKSLKDITILLSSHREAGLRLADKVIVLDHGKIVESGSYHSLLAHGGRLSQLIGSYDEIKA